MDGTAGIGGGSAGAGGAGWSIVGTGDFNGDGKSDILWAKGTSTWIWEMDGTTQIAGGSAGAAGAGWSIAGIGDFNGNTKRAEQRRVRKKGRARGLADHLKKKSDGAAGGGGGAG